MTNWNNEKEEARIILYFLGFDDGEIGMLSEPVVGKSNICSWRGRRGLLRNHGFSDRKWCSPNSPLKKKLGNRPGPHISEEREKLLCHLYYKGLNDREIAEKVDRERTTIRGWRLRKGLPANAVRGRQPAKEGGHKVHKKTRKIRKKQTKKKPEDKPRRRETAKERKESARKLAEQEERAIAESLPTKEEVYQKVRNSPDGQVTTAQLIKEKYGDVGQSRSRGRGRGDTISKLRELVDKDKKLTLDTSGKEIVWIA